MTTTDIVLFESGDEDLIPAETLAEVACTIRAGLALEERGQVAVANALWRLADMGMTQQTIAAWCRVEGFATLNQSRVSQLVSHAKTLAALSPITTTVIIAEGTLRPLSKALNKPRESMPLDQAERVIELIEDEPKPTAEKVAALVAATPWAKAAADAKQTKQTAHAPQSNEHDSTPADNANTICGEFILALRNMVDLRANVPFQSVPPTERSNRAAELKEIREDLTQIIQLLERNS